MNSLAEAAGLSSPRSRNIWRRCATRTGDLSAGKPDALVPHCRPPDRRPLCHVAQALLQTPQSTLNHGVSHAAFKNKPDQSQASAGSRSDPDRQPRGRRACPREGHWARHLPLSKLDEADLGLHVGKSVIFHCKSGARTMNNASQLARKTGGACEAFIVEVGLMPGRRRIASRNRSPPANRVAATSADRCRQSRIHRDGAGRDGFPVVSRGARVCRRRVDDGRRDGFCGMAQLLMRAPWNKAAYAPTVQAKAV